MFVASNVMVPVTGSEEESEASIIETSQGLMAVESLANTLSGRLMLLAGTLTTSSFATGIGSLKH